MSKYPDVDEDGIPYPDDDIDLDEETVLDRNGRRITSAVAEEIVRQVQERAG